MNNFNKIFRSKLYHHSVDVPEDIWDKIEATLPDEKKDINPLWFLLSLLAIAMAGIMTFIYFNEQRVVQNNVDILAKPTDNVHLNTSMDKVLLTKPYIDNRISQGRTSGNNMPKSLPVIQELKHSNFISIIRGKTKMDENGLAADQKQSRALIYVPMIAHKYGVTPYRKNEFTRDQKWSNQSMCPTIPLKRYNKSIDGYFSHDLNMRAISSTASGVSDYMSMREKVEGRLYSFSIGMRYNHHFTDRWAIVSGINYSQINELFQYVDPESTQIREITIKDYIYQNGIIADSIITIKTEVIPGDEMIGVKNKYRTVDIPLMAKYKLYNHKNLSVSAMSGIMLNIISKHNGMIFDTDNIGLLDINQQSDTNASIFRSKIGVSIIGSLNWGLNYLLS